MAEAFLTHPYSLAGPFLFWASNTPSRLTRGQGCELVRWEEQNTSGGNRDSLNDFSRDHVRRERQRRQVTRKTEGGRVPGVVIFLLQKGEGSFLSEVGVPALRATEAAL